jgi:predicted metal-dependent hydrolase
MENHTVVYENNTISFALIRKKVKNINLKVRPDLTVVVSANKTVPYGYIERFVREKAPWILKNQKYFADNDRAEKKLEYTSGKNIYYLGRPYRLQVLTADKKQQVYLNGDQICLYVKDAGDFSTKEKLIQNWYRDQAKIVFHRSIERIYPMVTRSGIEKPSITIRTMKTRWGSCSWKKQKITLNTELLKTPESCIDYVVLHELAHFKHRKHDADFYNFLSEIMPEWKEYRKYLKDKGGL